MRLHRFVLAIFAVIILMSMLFTSVACSSNEDEFEKLLDPNNPVTVEIWNYYSGAQANEFDELVKKFNESEGRERGIIVTTTAQSNINTLADELLKAVDGGLGAKPVPDVAAIYPETAYLLLQKDVIVSVEDYLSAEEWAQYIPSFLDTGRFAQGGKIYGFPVSKSTEILAYNVTDWAPFAAAKGVSIDSINTAEDMVSAAKLYYEWTDSLTPEVEDGKALYGRDSLANYLYLGAARMGKNIVTVNADGTVAINLDKDTFKVLWDNYYVPYINGYFAGYDRFRSGDMKTGKILACTGSSSSVNYIAETVTELDESTHAITLKFDKPLSLSAQAENVFVQQGASYYIMKSNAAKQYAASQFLKWFTAAEQNLSFSINVGYSPVKKDANTNEALTAAMEQSEKPSTKVLSSLLLSADIFNNSATYSAPAFTQAKALREYLETSFDKVLKADRQAVVSAIAQGNARTTAVAQYCTPAYFDTWFEELKNGCDAIVNQ